MGLAKWMVASKKADFEAISTKFNIDKVVARIIRNRDVIGDDEIELFLSDDMKYLHDPHLLKDLDKAVDILKNKISEGKKIRVIGDYDVDGICSTYILLKGLRTLGANVDTVIPHRIKDGYGLNDNLIEEAINDGVDTILTCDNGIAASSQIKLAKENGIDVIITDHHEVPYDIVEGQKVYTLPEALAVVDPKQNDCPYPFKSICGGFVAYKLITVLLDDKYPQVMEELISFATLATVCDVMELKDENRILVKNGLKKMAECSNYGLKALLIVNGLEDKKLTNYHLGFVIGPCLNATGRLDTAKRALELFDAPTFREASLIASELKELNESRKKMTEDGVKEALEKVNGSSMENDRVLVIYLPDTHESLAGIIAGRVKEKFNKPTLVLTKAEDGVKGSGRSIEAYDMFEELSKVKELFTKFGGHKMAAGISLKDEAQIKELRIRLNGGCTLTEDDLTKKIHIDVPMPLSYITDRFIRELDVLEPFGTGNPKPVFATRNISLISYIRMGKNKNVGKLRVRDENGREFEMIHFGDLDDFENFITDKFGNEAFERLSAGRLGTSEMTISIVYYPEINEFRGNENIQIIMNYYDV